MADTTKKQSIFDRLTDPSSFHGTHKHRFDKDGHGRGLEGRDSVAKGGGYVGGGRSSSGVSDLSQITRTHLNRSGGSMSPSRASPRSMSPSRGNSNTTSPRRTTSPRPVPERAETVPSGNSSLGTSPGTSPGTSSGQKKGSIFDRLSDPSSFHASHKHRFDKEGHGLGKAGRTQDTGTVDLCHLTRPNL